ncbi:MAG TPA: group 1 truncated hemoglobin [Anaeromyxobacteraceae bacterium]|nr:group 1 truncated hemoglobin [Anaeromyxobacteraceae bacterium]
MKMLALLVAVTFIAPAAVARAQSSSGPAGRPATPPTAASPAAKSLYARLGGVYPISVVVDDFIERLFVNDTLNANPAIEEARRRVPKQGLKFHVTALVCQVTGGPCGYVGRDMKSAHAHLHITAKEWDAMLADFRKTLDKFAVPAAEQGELVAIVNGTKADIVVGAKTSSR